MITTDNGRFIKKGICVARINTQHFSIGDPAIYEQYEVNDPGKWGLGEKTAYKVRNDIEEVELYLTGTQFNNQFERRFE